MKNILLISPYVASDVRAFWITGGDGEDIDKPGVMVPLGLATVAALTPDQHTVDIWDECIHGMIDEQTTFEREYDLIGITGYLPHIPRVKQIIRALRDSGIPIAVGGPGVSAAPHLLTDTCDHLFVGEVEKTWPEFMEDWSRGTARQIYRQIDKPDISTSPIPKWDALRDDLTKYANGCVQTTRGCPFDCEFCDVIYLYGRRQRHKPVENVMEEIRLQQALGMETIFLCDDEFIGNPNYAREVLKALIPLNRSFPKPLRFRTQITMNISKYEDILEMMADANFDMLIIGIETPNKASLKETGKLQNIRKDLVGDVHKVFEYGIGIRPGIIVGFDNDGPDIFDIQEEFISAACLSLVTLNMLKAPVGTRLWTRLRQDGRMLDWTKMAAQNTNPNRTTNIVPGGMSRVDLMRGFRDLQLRLHSWEKFGERLKGMISLVKRKPNVVEDPMPVEELRMLGERLRVGPEGSRVIAEIFDHVERSAPFLWRRIRSFIGTEAVYIDALPEVLRGIDEQIRREETGEVVVELDDGKLGIPKAFRENYHKKIFPAVYGRAYQVLDDESKLPEVLLDVLVDFIVRWGDELREVEEYHLRMLEQISDRSCARANGVAPETFLPEISDDAVIAKPPRYFEDEILKGVGQELFIIAKGGNKGKISA
jgi:radical SAM superfamily enzyme YgiQ (UPF0313 family)